jgi:RNA polymerase sigma-70 factor (ECF subfamily)
MSSDRRFADELLGQVPALRAFARSLAKRDPEADDLVQETLCKAWAKRDTFQEGTKLLAWLFTILRNHFYSEKRKERRLVEDPNGIYVAGLFTMPAQEWEVSFVEFNNAFRELSNEHREALFLVAACGLTYEETGEICGCPAGTIKSRVNRARGALGRRLGVSWHDIGADPRALAALHAAANFDLMEAEQAA